MPSPVQSNCDAHDTIANGQYGGVWSMGHTQQVCVLIVLLPSNVWQQFFGRSAFLRQQETDLPPAELCQTTQSWWRNWFVAGLLYLGLRVRPQTKPVDFPGTKNQQQPYRMIIRLKKDPLSARFAWMLSAKLNS
ncbi:hypothetical protein TNCV_4850261 [Trichonephila clavipes]|nr:hypothetical protein TNCV_4850261 [Trichonephila clavipes]